VRPDNVGTTRAMLSFLSDVRGLEKLSRADQIAILRSTFADVGWAASRILAELDEPLPISTGWGNCAHPGGAVVGWHCSVTPPSAPRPSGAVVRAWR
jgi:hypothetical protein